MKKILMAIPTKERSEMVREVLDYELPYYKKFDIEICFYDSSADERTYEVISQASKKHSLSLRYKKYNSELCLDYKIVEMFKDFSKTEFDYFWMLNDSISISEVMIIKVINSLDEEYDLIRLPLSGEGKVADYETENVNDWFRFCSQGMAHMASTVMSKSLLCVETDWDELSDKYIYNNELDDKHGYFFTVGFYLEQIQKLKHFKGLFIGNICKWRRDSPLKKDNIYWYSHVFETWAKSYPETILKLPEIYSDKETVIRNSDNIGPGRFSKGMLIHYRIKGLYNLSVFEKYRKYFKYVTEESEDTCYKIAVEPVDALRAKYPNLITIESSWEEKITSIEESLLGKDIYIYGAGLYGEKVLNKIINDGFVVRKILVTECASNVTHICGTDVCSIDEISIEEDAQIIICALPGTAEKIKAELDKRGIDNYIGLFDV